MTEIPDPEFVVRYNQQAWDTQVRKKNRWTVPVSADEIARARNGDVRIVLTPIRIVPANWLGNLVGCRTLCLAGAGGQQAPILAAAGAIVTVVDQSRGQLNQDQLVATREGLKLRTIQADMRDLSLLQDGEFDLIVHPCSNGFIPDVNPVWREAFRVLRAGGRLMAGFANPFIFLFDEHELTAGKLEVRYRLPYSDIEQLPRETLQKFIDEQEPLLFGHTLTDQIGGQLAAGFVLRALFEDNEGDGPIAALNRHTATYIATLAEKPSA